MMNWSEDAMAMMKVVDFAETFEVKVGDGQKVPTEGWSMDKRPQSL
jgi:hypothetical protein